MATRLRSRLLNVEDFLGIDFGPNLKAELDNGRIRMMAGGTHDRSRIQMNLYRYLGVSLRGSGCRPHGSDMGIVPHDQSLRYPDVTINCRPAEGKDRYLAAPSVVIEVLSPSTRDEDLGVKLAEYRSMASLDCIAFVDPDTETSEVHHRDADRQWIRTEGTDLSLPSLDLTVPHAEIFADD